MLRGRDLCVTIRRCRRELRVAIRFELRDPSLTILLRRRELRIAVGFDLGDAGVAILLELGELRGVRRVCGRLLLGERVRFLVCEALGLFFERVLVRLHGGGGLLFVLPLCVGELLLGLGAKLGLALRDGLHLRFDRGRARLLDGGGVIARSRSRALCWCSASSDVFLGGQRPPRDARDRFAVRDLAFNVASLFARRPRSVLARRGMRGA